MARGNVMMYSKLLEDQDDVEKGIHPNWMSPLVEYSISLQQSDRKTPLKMVNLFDRYALQYMVTLKRGMFVEHLEEHSIFCEIFHSSISLHCSNDTGPERINYILNELFKAAFEYVIDLQSEEGRKFSRQIMPHGPTQVTERSAIVIKHDTKMICVSDNNDCIDSLLDEMGYHEVEYVDIKQFVPNLFSLGIEDASLHPNIKSIKVQHSQQACCIVWKGRAKEMGDALIHEFLKTCLQKHIDFVEGEQRRPYTDLACKVIFDERGDIKKHYAQYLKRISKKKSKCTHFSLVQKDGRVVLYGRNGNVDNVKKEIEESVSKHNLEMNLFEQTDVLNFLKKHKEKLWYDMLNGTLLCTRDLTSEIIKLCTSRPVRQRFEFNTEPVLLVAFLQENGEDLLKHAKLLGVDILFDGTNIFLQSFLDQVCKEFHIDLQKAVDNGRIVLSVNVQFTHTDMASIQNIMNQSSCSWFLHCNQPTDVMSSQTFCKRWIDPDGSTQIWLAEKGAAIPCTDICIVFTADMLRQLGISSRRTDVPKSKTSKEGYSGIETFYGPFPVSKAFVGCRTIHLLDIKVEERKKHMDCLVKEIAASRDNSNQRLCIVAATGNEGKGFVCKEIISQFVTAVREHVHKQRPSFTWDIYILVDNRNMAIAETSIESSLSGTFNTSRRAKKNGAKKTNTDKTISWQLRENEAFYDRLELIGRTKECALKAKKEVLQYIEETKRLNCSDADNQSDLKKSQTDKDDDDQCRFQDMEMSATINPGIFHFLGANFARWVDAVKKHLDVTIEVTGSGSARVIGDFKNIMSFEKYLQTQFPKDPDVISE